MRAGQVLARIDARTADQAVAASHSQIAEAEANLANARRKHERNRELVAQKFVSQAAVDQAEAEYKAAQAQLAAVKANAGAGGRGADVQYDHRAVCGRDRRDAARELGDMAQPGRALFTVFDPRELRVAATCRRRRCQAEARGAGARRDPRARQELDGDEGDGDAAGRRPHAHHAAYGSTCRRPKACCRASSRARCS